MAGRALNRSSCAGWRQLRRPSWPTASRGCCCSCCCRRCPHGGVLLRGAAGSGGGLQLEADGHDASCYGWAGRSAACARKRSARGLGRPLLANIGAARMTSNVLARAPAGTRAIRAGVPDAAGAAVGNSGLPLRPAACARTHLPGGAGAGGTPVRGRQVLVGESVVNRAAACWCWWASSVRASAGTRCCLLRRRMHQWSPGVTSHASCRVHR